MFDGSLPEVADFSALTDAELVAASAGWARVESAAASRKLAAMAEVFRRRTGIEDAAERENWFVDAETSVLSELAGAHHITEGLAKSQTQRGVLLANRFPEVFALFQQGLISDLLVRSIVYRTYLITDPDAMAAVDAALAEQVLAWGPKSQTKTEEAIDALVEIHDPAALRRREPTTHTRNVEFGNFTDAAGMMTVCARMYSPDGVALQQHVENMARSVCPDDPRSMGDRRNDAFAALSTGKPLRCECDNPECPATSLDQTAPTVIIHLITTQDTLDQAQTRSADAAEPDDVEPDDVEPTADGSSGPPDRAESAEIAPPGEPAARLDVDTDAQPGADVAAECRPVDAEHEEQPIEETEPAACEGDSGGAERARTDSQPHPTPAPAFVIGGGVLSPVVLPAFLDRAKIRQLRHPGDAPPEPHHRPSAALADFVRCRDLTCRFPGCDAPATRCDIDHTVPWPAGPTCASNLKSLCRKHHLLKTFWTGENGWRERQFPDGTVVWTSPSGQTYTTQPGSMLLFPTLSIPTAPAPLKPVAETSTNRGLMMPKRRRTREQDRARRIKAERKLNDDLVAERNKPPPF